MTSPDNERLFGLDVLRALAISLVVMSHLPTEAIPLWLKDFGSSGVDLFFVLSGYLIGSQLLKQIDQKKSLDISRFYWRRAFRILPAFWAVLALYLLFPPLNWERSSLPLWGLLTLIQNFLTSYDPDTIEVMGFSHAWSLSVEEHFYIVLPIIILGLASRIRQKTALLLFTTLLLAGILLRFFIWKAVLHKHIEWAPYQFLAAMFHQYIYYPTYCRLDGLLFGVGLATIEIFKPTLWRTLLNERHLLYFSGILAGALSIYYSILFAKYSFTRTLFYFPLISYAYAVMIFFTLHKKSITGFRFPGVKGLAKISYSVYLVHNLVIYHGSLAIESMGLSPTGVLGSGILVGLILIFSAGLFFLIEWPFLQMRERLAFSR